MPTQMASLETKTEYSEQTDTEIIRMATTTDKSTNLQKTAVNHMTAAVNLNQPSQPMQR